MYKNKFDKYISKLKIQLNQHGGQIVKIPHPLPEGQSWFFMPILLFAFSDIYVDFANPDPSIRFNDIIEDSLNKPINVKRDEVHITYTTTLKDIHGDSHVESLIDFLKNEYIARGIDLGNRRTLVNALHGLAYDDVDFVHLTAESQERLLASLGLWDIASSWALELMFNHAGKDFTFSITG